MTRKRHAAPKPLRVCLYCSAPISEQRPPYLVGHPSGRIVGPFHAGCAERMILAARKHTAPVEEVLGEQYGTWPSRREETLPW